MSQEVGNFNSFLFLLDLINSPTHCPVFQSSWEELPDGSQDLVSAAGITTPDEDKFTGMLELHGYCQDNSCNFNGECFQSSPYTYNCKCDEGHKGERCQIEMNMEFKVRKISGSTLNSRYACEFINLADGDFDTITITGKDLHHPHCWVLHGPFDDAYRYYATYDAVGALGDTECDNRNAVFHTFHGALSHIDTCELASLRLRAKHEACLADLPSSSWVDEDWDTITVLYNPTQESINLDSASITYSIEENECRSGNHDCHSSAICSDLPNASTNGADSWTCECDKSHTGDGKTSCTSNAVVSMKATLTARIAELKSRVEGLQAKFQGIKVVLDNSDAAIKTKLEDALVLLVAADSAFAQKIITQLGDISKSPREGPMFVADAAHDGDLDTINSNIVQYNSDLDTEITAREDGFQTRREAITAFQTTMEGLIANRHTLLDTTISDLHQTDADNWAVWVGQREEVSGKTDDLEADIEAWNEATTTKLENLEIDDWIEAQTTWNGNFQNNSVNAADDGIDEWAEEIPQIIEGWRKTKDVFKGTLSTIEHCCSNPIKFDIDVNTGDSYGTDGYYRAPFPGYYFVSFNVYADDSAIIGVDLLKNSVLVKGDVFLMDWQRAGVDLLSQSTVLHLEKDDEVNLWLNNANLHNEGTQSGTRKTGQSTFTIFLIQADYTYSVIDNLPEE